MKNIRTAFDGRQHIVLIYTLLYTSLAVLKCNLKILYQKILIRLDLHLEGPTRPFVENAMMKTFKTMLFLVQNSWRANVYRKENFSRQHVL